MLRSVLLLVAGGLLVGVPAAAAAPAPPALVGAVSNTGSLSGTTSVAVSGQYAYTTAYWAGVLTAVNISNPMAPTVAGSSAPAMSLYDGVSVNVAGGYAFVTSKNRNGPCTPGPPPACSAGSNDDGTGNSLTILDIHSSPAAPAIVGTLHDPANLFGAYGVAVSGGYAYVASQGLLGGQPTSPDTSTGAFSVISLNNLAAPAIVGHLDNGSLPAPFTGTGALDHATSVAVWGHYAYVTAFNSDRFTVIDISNPASPMIVASLHDSTNLAFPNDVAVSGNYAYVANQTGSSQTNFTVVDVSNPLSPRVVGSVAPQSALAGAYRVRVSGSFAYISASNTATVAAIDVSNPASPRIAGSVTSTANLNSTTGLDFDPSGGYIIAASPRAASESNPIYPPFPMNTGTISAIQLDPVPIAMTIDPTSEPPATTTQTSASFSFAPTDQIATLPECRLDGAPFTACTSPTTQNYTSLSPGNHTFSVQTTDALGTLGTANYMWSVASVPVPPPPVADAPANTTPPAVSGTAAIGQPLSCGQGAWTGTLPIVYFYTWTRDGTTIAGATGSTYVIATADAGHQLACVVRANGFGTATAPSASVPPPAGKVQIGRPRLLGNGAISVKVSCASIPGTICALSLNVIGAAKPSKGVLLASKSAFTLRAGQQATVKLSRDRAARRLFLTHNKLDAQVELVEFGSNGQQSVVSNQHLTLRSGKR